MENNENEQMTTHEIALICEDYKKSELEASQSQATVYADGEERGRDRQR